MNWLNDPQRAQHKPSAYGRRSFNPSNLNLWLSWMDDHTKTPLIYKMFVRFCLANCLKLPSGRMHHQLASELYIKDSIQSVYMTGYSNSIINGVKTWLCPCAAGSAKDHHKFFSQEYKKSECDQDSGKATLRTRLPSIRRSCWGGYRCQDYDSMSTFDSFNSNVCIRNTKTRLACPANMVSQVWKI